MPILSGHRVYRNLDVDESGDSGVVGRLRVFTIVAFNDHATDIRYLKLYDKATAPTVGTDTPKITIPITAGGPHVIPTDQDGILFESGLGVGATTAIADNDTGAPGANDVVIAVTHDGR